jgi:hypothetical protein
LFPLSVCRKQFFADIAEVVDVRLGVHEDGHPKGFGHVEFATAEGAEKVNVSVLVFTFSFCEVNNVYSLPSNYLIFTFAALVQSVAALV